MIANTRAFHILTYFIFPLSNDNQCEKLELFICLLQQQYAFSHQCEIQSGIGFLMMGHGD